MNTDQGSQYTSHIHTQTLTDNGIIISMDGKGRATDNICIERFWRSAKVEKIYLNEYFKISTLKNDVSDYMKFYNHRRFHEALNYKGFVLEDLGRLQEAVSSFDKAFRVNPDFIAALNNKGLVLDKLGKHDEAIEAYNSAIQANPAFDTAWFNMAGAYSLIGEKDNMLNSLKKAIDLNPRYKMTLQQIPDFQRFRNDPEFLRLSGR